MLRNFVPLLAAVLTAAAAAGPVRAVTEPAFRSSSPSFDAAPASAALSVEVTPDCDSAMSYDDNGPATGGPRFVGHTEGPYHGHVMRFDPVAYPAPLERVCLFLIRDYNFPLDDVSFEIIVHDDDGLAGRPGTLLGVTTVSVQDLPASGRGAWYSFDVPGLVAPIQSGSVYVGFRFAVPGYLDPLDHADGILLGGDSSAVWHSYSSIDGLHWDFEGADLGVLYLIRAQFTEPSEPGAPDLVSADSDLNSDGSVTVSWRDLSTNEHGFRILWREPNASYVEVGRAWRDTSTAVIPYRGEGVLRNLVVDAVNSAGTSRSAPSVGLLAPLPTVGAYGHWEPLSVEGLALVSPFDPSELAIPLGSELLRSHDGGQSFSPQALPFFPTYYGALAWDLQPGYLWSTSGSSPMTVYRSQSDGQAWSAVGQLPGSGVQPKGIETDRNRPGQAFFYLGQQTLRTRDGGASWEELSVAGSGLRIRTMPGSPGVLLGTNYSGVWRSDDDGLSWQNLEDPEGHNYPWLVEISSADSSIWVAHMGENEPPGVRNPLSRQRSGSASWEVIAAPCWPRGLFPDPAYSETLYIDCHPYTIGPRFRKTIDGGTHWYPMVNGTSGYTRSGAMSADGHLFVNDDRAETGYPLFTYRLPQCTATLTAACIQGGRFRVEAYYRDFAGNIGKAHAQPLSADTAYFWFFDSANVEIVAKVIDGSTLNGAYWVFYGALSNVEYLLVVTDTQTGTIKTYRNPAGHFASAGDAGAFPAPTNALLSKPLSKPVLRPSSAPAGQPLRLRDDRFEITSTWADFQGGSGAGIPVQLTSDSGYFWFFGASNVELVIKVIDGRALNGHYWVYYGALSNVDFEVTVLDTVTNESRTYHNPAGTFASVGDILALPGE